MPVADYEMVCGLEVHVELQTKTKIFCGCTTEFGGEQNTHVCPVCLGMPGTLPVLNREVVNYAIKAGLALNCEIADFSKFDRKNYYYPDLTKNYQTSQYDLPICKTGGLVIEVDGEQKWIGITRAHMEEVNRKFADAQRAFAEGLTLHRLTHRRDEGLTRFDFADIIPLFNRACVARGVVPDFRRPNGLRLGLSPLSTTFDEVRVGVEAVRDALVEVTGE